MRMLIVNDQDFEKAIKVLADNGIDTEAINEPSIPLIRKSNATPDDSPASFGGIWENDDRTFQSIRVKAWPGRR
ncbi:hypothetical protein BLX24_10415 [Arsenicibacter rosenii]|uniref:Uncharacterized protein n=1 Tax=Arsenicibacter rosenii TaxID=1750698 RepID=A0A1S2VKT2_9BACT|nr:hypothetical protein BLX24_10415 [Arsenicibacter rosenii]